MSDTPRHDDSQEFRDPTAPSDSSTSDSGSGSGDSGSGSSGDSGSGSSGDHTSPIETGQTQQVPPVPPARPAGPPPGSAPQNPYAAPPSLSGNTIALLVVSGLTTIGCGFGLVGLIFAIIAATKKDRPDESAKYTKWGWIAVVVGFVLSILVIVGIIAIAIASDSGSSYDTGY